MRSYTGAVNSSKPGIRSELGGYRLSALLSQGNASRLFRGREAQGGDDVLLELPVEGLRASEGFADKLAHDTAAAARLGNPHIARATVETDGDVPFTVSPDPRGVELTPLVEGLGGLSLTRSAEIVAQVAGALAAAHTAGLVHGTFEPSRVLVASRDGEDHAIVTGFGFQPPPGSDRGARRPFGLPAADFCAPEQVRGEPATAASDIYALGCVLYHALLAEAPFAAGDEMATLDAQVHHEPPRPSERMPELPAEIDDVIARALAKNAGDRYESADRLAFDLQTIAAGVAAGEGAPAPTVSARKKDTTLRWEQSIAGGAHKWSPSNPVTTWPEAGSDDVTAVDPAVAEPAAAGEGAGDGDSHDALSWPQPPHPQEKEAPAAPPSKPREPSSPGRGRKVFARVLAGLVAVGTAVALVVLLSDGDDSDAPSRPAAADSAPPAKTPSTGGTSANELVPWPRRNAYTAVISVSADDRAAVRASARRAARLGYRAGVLESGDYPNLPSGRFVGFAGVYDSKAEAERAARRLRAQDVAASPYVRQVRGAGR